jgi:hypothetical protein
LYSARIQPSPIARSSPPRDNLSTGEDELRKLLLVILIVFLPTSLSPQTRFFPAQGAKATVLIFVSVDCPVSNRYAPEIRKLHDEFTSQGMRFWLVYPNVMDGDAEINAHLKAYDFPAIALADREHRLVKLAGATVTPEAAVFDDRLRILYRGRIDNRFVELGRERPTATRQDLRSALVATLAGRPVVPARTQAVGCFIADMGGPGR